MVRNKHCKQKWLEIRNFYIIIIELNNKKK
jgi:hypothetical protein